MTSIAMPLRMAMILMVIATLYFARVVLIPVALSLLLCFFLSPVLSRLRRWGLGRVLAVALTVSLAAGVVVSIGSFVALQIVDVTMSLPEYQSNIEQKLGSLRVKPDGPMDRAIRMFARLSEGLNYSVDGPPPGETPETDAEDEAGEKPPPAQVVQPTLTPGIILRNVLGAAKGPLTTAGIVFVLVIFMLLEREELRDRFIRMLGTAPGQLNNTTQALDAAARRVTRFLLMQVIVNVSFGMAIGAGLFLIGVPNPALWGLLATVLRFIPYVGPWIAALCPIAVAFSVDPGWMMVIETILLFTITEIISNNFIETWLYGTSMGIKSVAILLSALFWAWLWGPIGLLMSTPLTVCLVVLGRYIPALRALSLWLGDQPALPLYARMYQRFLAMDPDEPDRIAYEYLATHTVEEFYGKVLVPALRLLEDERYQESLEPARREFMLDHIRELVEDVADHPDPAPKPDSRSTEAATTPTREPDKETSVPEAAPSAPVLPIPSVTDMAQTLPPVVVCLPAHDASDEIVALMISILLRRRGIRASTITADLRAADRITRLEDEGASIACISVLPPFAAVYARHTAQRIRARVPGMKIIVGFWEPSAVTESLTAQLINAGATEVVSTVAQAVASLAALAASAPPAEQDQAGASDRRVIAADSQTP